MPSTTPAVSTVHPDATTPPVETMGRDAFVTDRVAAYTAAGVSPADVLDAATDAEEQGRGELAGWYRETARRMRVAEVAAEAERRNRLGLRAAVGIIVAMVAAMVVLAAMGYGNAESRARVGLPVAEGPVAAAAGPVAGTVDGLAHPVAVCGGDAECEALDAAAGPVAAEDGPGWDCSTMGNRQCGPGAEGGPLVVDAVPGAAPYAWCPAGRGGVLRVNGAGVQVCAYGTGEVI